MDVYLSRACCAKVYRIPVYLVLCQINDLTTAMAVASGGMLSFGNRLSTLSYDAIVFGQSQIDLDETIVSVSQFNTSFVKSLGGKLNE
jgi:hypothetical protein